MWLAWRNVWCDFRLALFSFQSGVLISQLLNLYSKLPILLKQLFYYVEQSDDEGLYRFFIIEVDLIHVKADKIFLYNFSHNGYYINNIYL